MSSGRELRVKRPPSRPVMLYDGDCAFCRYWVERWKSATGGKIDYRPLQERRFAEISEEASRESVQLVETDGKVFTGARAIIRALDYARGPNVMAWVARSMPILGVVLEKAYRFIARRRRFFSFVTAFFWGRGASGPPRYAIADWMFLRVLGLIYLVAFVSVGVQILGLVGRRGVLPAQEFLTAVRSQIGLERYHQLPTFFWISASDGALVAGALAGAVLSIALMLGFAPGVSLVLLWALYLSIVTVCRTFLSYQWDVMLLEAGFLAIFLAPFWSARAHHETASMRLARLLLLWLLFRLNFQSGVVKLSSGDETWHNLSALAYHHETQPLPVWTSWYAHQAPLWVHKSSAVFLFVIELGLPFLIFAPRNLRRAACVALASLQAMIAATGNYGFFNFLSAGLCFLLLDDQVWPERWRRRLISSARPTSWPLWVAAPVGALNLIITTMLFTYTFRSRLEWPKPLATLHRAVAPFHTFNSYGLFAVMTTTRPEIIIEGSNDGETWLPYEFKWKPGNVYQRPRLVAPHQPRLDWQMWFAALGNYQANPWLLNFMVRLLEGSPEVLRLLQSNPFPDAPPRYVRAVLYNYNFTRREEETAAWWKRELKGLYTPPLTLERVAQKF